MLVIEKSSLTRAPGHPQTTGPPGFQSARTTNSSEVSHLECMLLFLILISNSSHHVKNST